MFKRILPSPYRVYGMWRSNLGYDPARVANSVVLVAQQKMKKPLDPKRIDIPWKNITETYLKEFPNTKCTEVPDFHNEEVQYEVNKALMQSGWMAKWEGNTVNEESKRLIIEPKKLNPILQFIIDTILFGIFIYSLIIVLYIILFFIGTSIDLIQGRN